MYSYVLKKTSPVICELLPPNNQTTRLFYFGLVLSVSGVIEVVGLFWDCPVACCLFYFGSVPSVSGVLEVVGLFWNCPVACCLFYFGSVLSVSGVLEVVGLFWDCPVAPALPCARDIPPIRGHKKSPELSFGAKRYPKDLRETLTWRAD
ncbi:hypothetical protein TDB9533_03432 [Thalassocella blandensis]|nr:hypothetical protein TDB9533_03432 [Thalassocella blandensis]